ncbi:MAG: peptidoglycan-binding protein, partial [Clostridiales bacterium]|nr:peptidoglycan-binding protein [Clostridiales bacterium]
MKIGRRLLAIMMAVLMLLSMMPTTAMAHAICDKCTWSKWKTEDGSPMSCGYKRTYRQCKVCGNMEFKEEFYDCEWGKWHVVKEGTDCQTWDGLKERKCKNCGGVMQDEIKGDHKWGKWKTTKEATCTAKGSKERKCTVCGKKQTDSIPAGAHKWGAWTVIQEAKEGQVGIRERKCTLCGKTQQEKFYLEGTLKNGDRGDDVKDLQESLNDQGYDSGKPDGIFGPNTENALKDWQEDNGYEPDGIGWPSQVDEILNGGDDAEETKKYSSSIDLELLTDCSQLSGELGQTISVRAKITNTGETVLTVNSSIMFDGNGNQPDSIDYIHWDIDNGKGGGTSWFDPGQTTEGTLNIVVEQSDIDAGEIVRKYTEYARPLYCVVDEKITDVPSGLGIDPEGTNKHTSKEEEKVEDTIEIRIPLAQKETKKYSSGIDLELLTDCSQLSGELGQTISVRAKITNTGETVLTVNSYIMLDGNGNKPASMDYIHWDIDNGKGGGTSWFDPGETTEGTPDVDGDGIPNGEDPDVDGDGIPNGEDPDVDGDGIPNGE